MQAKLLRGKVQQTMRLTFRFFFHGLTICRLTSGNVYVKINVIRSTGLFNPYVDGRRGQSIQACQRQSCWLTSEYQHIQSDTLAFFLFFKFTLTRLHPSMADPCRSVVNVKDNQKFMNIEFSRIALIASSQFSPDTSNCQRLTFEMANLSARDSGGQA
jgi:hypothetical protein